MKYSVCTETVFDGVDILDAMKAVKECAHAAHDNNVEVFGIHPQKLSKLGGYTAAKLEGRPFSSRRCPNHKPGQYAE